MTVTSKIAKKLERYLIPGEQITHTIDTMNWQAPKGSTPAIGALTARRLIVVQKIVPFGQPQSTMLDLGSIVDVQSGGGLVPRVTLRTAGGVGLTLSTKQQDVMAIQAAIAAARG